MCCSLSFLLKYPNSIQTKEVDVIETEFYDPPPVGHRGPISHLFHHSCTSLNEKDLFMFKLLYLRIQDLSFKDFVLLRQIQRQELLRGCIWTKDKEFQGCFFGFTPRYNISSLFFFFTLICERSFLVQQRPLLLILETFSRRYRASLLCFCSPLHVPSVN